MGIARLVYYAAIGTSLAASPANAKPGIEITGTAPLDPAIWISSEPFDKTRGIDSFLRAHIDKADGKVTYQIYIVTRTTRDAFRPRSITIMGANGIEQFPLDRVNFDVSCQRWGCVYMEDAIAELPRALLERISSDDFSRTLTFKAFGDATNGRDGEIMSAEIAEFLIAVDHELAAVTK
jgi:hypothetical protein